MENASKALYMAAGILISLMIVAIFVYLFNAGGNLGEKYEERQSQEQLHLFNSKFENFARSNNSISDMISVTNLAINTNEENEYNTQKTVEIEIEIASSVFLSVSSKYEIERNNIFIGKLENVSDSSEKIYVYDLMNRKIDEIESKYTLSINQACSNADGVLRDIVGTDTFSIVDNNMKYKYQFKNTDIQYHESTGRVKYMKFEISREY